MSLSGRHFFTLVLLCLILPLQELWHYFDTPFWNRNVNPWMARDFVIHITWYVKLLSEKIAVVLYNIIIFRLSRMNMLVRIAATSVFVFTGVDTLLFFVNCNQMDYSLVYSCLEGVVLLIAWSYHRSYTWPSRMKALCSSLAGQLKTYLVNIIHYTL